MARLGPLVYVALTLAIFALCTTSQLVEDDFVHAVDDHAMSVMADEKATTCFPALNFVMPDPRNVPSDPAAWWCDPRTEYAFLGFSYEVTACQSKDQLKREFADARKTFKSRYVRLYGFCDRKGFYDDIVEAAWSAGIGVHALIWFGWDGSNKWIARRDALFNTLHTNPLAKYVTRVVQFGSEPLFDYAISAGDLTTQVVAARRNLAPLKIPVTVSELAYGYQARAGEGSQGLLDILDSINIHMLPFFSWTASTANNSWPDVTKDLNWFISHGNGKKMYLSQNGWPSTTYPGVEPNSPKAVANIQNEGDYFRLLNSKCSFFKTVVGGGVGWFWHLYSDNQEPGYGLYNYDGKVKFAFSPRTAC